MKKELIYSMILVVSTMLGACADHDDPKLAPIDTTQVKISAQVTDEPTVAWLDVTEEMTIKVTNVEMSAPKGVVLRSISLIATVGTGKYQIDEKPYSGEPLEYKIALNRLQGRVNFCLIGNLIKQGSRDAEIIIADNIQKIVFSERPELECESELQVTVKSRSTTGEEYLKTFEVKSADRFTLPIPQSELYWTPSTGSASTVELTLESSAAGWSPNTTFDCRVTKLSIGHSSGEESTLKITIPNTPGALNSQKLQLYVLTSFFGTWEGVTIEPYNLINVFGIVETK